MRLTVRLSGNEIRLDATQVSRSFASIRLTPQTLGTRIALRIFAVGLLHPDLTKVRDSAVQDWVAARTVLAAGGGCSPVDR
jgi:hypothetical protein